MAEEIGGGDVGGGLPGFVGDRRLLLIAAVAVVLVLIMIFALVRSCGVVRRGPEYVVLYSHLELKDTADVVTKLKDMRIPYEIRDEGRSVAVPKDMADEARLGLAEESLPVGGTVGWEIFDETKLGATDFDRRIQFIRAVSGELARTILRIDAIDDCRVQIVIPETRLFEVARAPVTASVLLKLKVGEKLSGPQINGIIHLVASSVENLKPENVTVVDIYGNILTPTMIAGAPSRTMGGFVSDEEIREQIEAAKKKGLAEVMAKEEELKAKEEELKKKEERLEKLMVSKMPSGKVMTEEELKKKVAEEEKTPSELTGEDRAMLRLKMKKEIDAQLSAKAQKVLNKFYPPNTSVVNVNVELGPPKVEYVPEEVKIKSEIKKEISLKAKELVTIRRITAIVLVDKKLELTQQLKKDTYSSVAGAIGYDRGRGDRIILRKVPFRLAEAPPAQPPAEVTPEKEAKGPVNFSAIMGALKKLFNKVKSTPLVGGMFSAIFTSKSVRNVLLGIIGFLVILYILRRIFGRQATEEYEAAPEAEDAEVVGPGGGEAKKAPAAGTTLDQVRRVAISDPQKIANLLKTWLSEEAA